MSTWLLEILDESSKEVSQWPAWRREPEMSSARRNVGGRSLDPDVVESRLAELDAKSQQSEESSL